MGVLALFIGLASVLLPQSTQAALPLQEYTYAECSRADEAAVEAEMSALAHAILVEESSALAIDSLVATIWRDTDADATFNAAVDAGIARVQAEEDYWGRLWSGWSAEKAEELASQVAIYAFEDAAFQAKLEEISTALAAGLVVELESAAARSASSALLCLQSYVGDQYSTTLFTAFEQSVSQELEAELDLSNADAATISPLDMHTKGLAGVGVIVATQITRRVAQSLAQKITGRLAGKIAGRVLGRLGSSVIPYVGWAVGVGLLVWDLVEGSQGALPTIRDALQAEEVKQEVRVEIAAAVREGIAAEVETMASTLALTLVGQWQTFCTNNGDVCQLAAENSTFRTLLNNMPVTDLTRLVQLIGFFQAELEATQLATALDDGTLAKLVAAPPAADVILAWSGSPATTMAWVELAGADLPRVVELQLYETIVPLQMTRLSLAALLAIDDNAIIHKLRVLPVEQLLVLLQLPTADLKQVVAITTPDELSWFADYLATLPSDEVASVTQELVNGGVTIAALQAPLEITVSEDGRAEGTSTSDLPDNALAGAEERPLAGVLPEAVVALWMPWINNGVAVAATIVVLLLVVVGVVLALRRELTDPPV